ncbi:hypothetical protein AAG570_001586 [Ranatra chinensis]|uniref:Folate receptor-like domain-containing protein n=1 Tax=Ranatra chinensis TaxID=642074 RepID=A0ABD0Y8Z4_9HEMI
MLQCTPWKNFSCCTHETTSDAHKLKLYNFNFEHCPKKMSEECRKHFVRDLCFYECSPNIGPWIVKVNMKIRRERFFGVPLCQSDCDAWFSACVDDYTCTDNWARNFVWNSTGNQCPPNSQCMKFKDVFKTAKNFCEKVIAD